MGYSEIEHCRIFQHGSGRYADCSMFVRQVSDLLKPGGIAILCMRFTNVVLARKAWEKGAFDLKRIAREILPYMRYCRLIDNPSWQLESYSPSEAFASVVFEKMPDGDDLLEFNENLTEMLSYGKYRNDYLKSVEEMNRYKKRANKGILSIVAARIRKISRKMRGAPQ